jgi:hypothetical protein
VVFCFQLNHPVHLSARTRTRTRTHAHARRRRRIVSNQIPIGLVRALRDWNERVGESFGWWSGQGCAAPGTAWPLPGWTDAAEQRVPARVKAFVRSYFSQRSVQIFLTASSVSFWVIRARHGRKALVHIFIYFTYLIPILIVNCCCCVVDTCGGIRARANLVSRRIF